MAIFAALALVPAAGATIRSPAAATETSLVNAVNQVRAARGLPRLRYDPTLRIAAWSHSMDMVRRGYFSHGPLASRMRRFGVRGPRVGENLAWGVGDGATTRWIISRWLASPGHRANLLRPGFRRIGVGLVIGRFAGKSSASVVTADFAGR